MALWDKAFLVEEARRREQVWGVWDKAQRPVWLGPGEPPPVQLAGRSKMPIRPVLPQGEPSRGFPLCLKGPAWVPLWLRPSLHSCRPCSPALPASRPLPLLLPLPGTVVAPSLLRVASLTAFSEEGRPQVLSPITSPFRCPSPGTVFSLLSWFRRLSARLWVTLSPPQASCRQRRHHFSS